MKTYIVKVIPDCHPNADGDLLKIETSDVPESECFDDLVKMLESKVPSGSHIVYVEEV